MGKRGEWGRVEMSLTSGFDGGGGMERGRVEDGVGRSRLPPLCFFFRPFPVPEGRESVPIFMFLPPSETHAFEKRGQIL